jgi:hypothetical protein
MLKSFFGLGKSLNQITYRVPFQFCQLNQPITNYSILPSNLNITRDDYKILNQNDQQNNNLQIIEFDEPVFDCRNKRFEQARRKRLKRKNGTKNKVRWR